MPDTPHHSSLPFLCKCFLSEMQENSYVFNVRRRARFCLALSEDEILFPHSFIPAIVPRFQLSTLVVSSIEEERRQPPQERDQTHTKIQTHNVRSKLRYWIVPLTCSAVMSSVEARSAMVRATLRMRS